MGKLKLLKKRIRRRTLFFLILALMANSFAWFIYSNKVSSSLTTGVKSWKINFNKDGADLTNNIEFKVDSIYPGMEEYSDSISITNAGELAANVKYEITYVRIFDDEYSSSDYDSDALLEILNTKYPFIVDFSVSNSVVNTGKSTAFTFTLNWPYESGNDSLDTFYGKKASSWNENSSSKAMVEIKALVTASQEN